MKVKTILLIVGAIYAYDRLSKGKPILPGIGAKAQNDLKSLKRGSYIINTGRDECNGGSMGYMNKSGIWTC